MLRKTLTNRIDKMHRHLDKYRQTTTTTFSLSNLNCKKCICLNLICLLLLSLVIGLFLLLNSTYNATYMYHAEIFQKQLSVEEIFQTDELKLLYLRFHKQLVQSRQHPRINALNTVLISENQLHVRSLTIQYLYDYLEQYNTLRFVKEFEEDANFKHVKCIETFTPKQRHKLIEYTIAVKQFVKHHSLYSQAHTSTLAHKEIITEDNSGDLPIVGQYGVVALQDIPQYTTIGHYYGDEYLLKEFDHLFEWKTYGDKPEHPFRKKWDYYMTIPYYTYYDERFLIEKNTTMTMDAFHRYDYREYLNDMGGGQVLNREQSNKKDTIESTINDCRSELKKPNMSKQDLRRKNVEFAYCKVNGITHCFAILTKAVRKGDQLFVYYGPNYG